MKTFIHIEDKGLSFRIIILSTVYQILGGLRTRCRLSLVAFPVTAAPQSPTPPPGMSSSTGIGGPSSSSSFSSSELVRDATSPSSSSTASAVRAPLAARGGVFPFSRGRAHGALHGRRTIGGAKQKHEGGWVGADWLAWRKFVPWVARYFCCLLLQ